VQQLVVRAASAADADGRDATVAADGQGPGLKIQTSAEEGPWACDATLIAETTVLVSRRCLGLQPEGGLREDFFDRAVIRVAGFETAIKRAMWSGPEQDWALLEPLAPDLGSELGWLGVMWTTPAAFGDVPRARPAWSWTAGTNNDLFAAWQCDATRSRGSSAATVVCPDELAAAHGAPLLSPFVCPAECGPEPASDCPCEPESSPPYILGILSIPDDGSSSAPVTLTASDEFRLDIVAWDAGAAPGGGNRPDAPTTTPVPTTLGAGGDGVGGSVEHGEDKLSGDERRNVLVMCFSIVVAFGVCCALVGVYYTSTGHVPRFLRCFCHHHHHHERPRRLSDPAPPVQPSPSPRPVAQKRNDPAVAGAEPGEDLLGGNDTADDGPPSARGGEHVEETKIILA